MKKGEVEAKQGGAFVTKLAVWGTVSWGESGRRLANTQIVVCVCFLLLLPCMPEERKGWWTDGRTEMGQTRMSLLAGGGERDSPNIDLHLFLSTLSMDKTLLNLSWAVKRRRIPCSSLTAASVLLLPLPSREGKRLLDGGGGGTCTKEWEKLGVGRQEESVNRVWGEEKTLLFRTVYLHISSSRVKAIAMFVCFLCPERVDTAFVFFILQATLCRPPSPLASGRREMEEEDGQAVRRFAKLVGCGGKSLCSSYASLPPPGLRRLLGKKGHLCPRPLLPPQGQGKHTFLSLHPDRERMETARE